MRFSVAAVWASMAVSLVCAIDTIEVKGRHFYNSATNKPFFVSETRSLIDAFVFFPTGYQTNGPASLKIRGVDYQPGGSAGFKEGSDPLSDPEKCARDVFLFQKLKINTIRVYSVDPLLDHDECMTMLAAAGIYLVLDVNTPLQDQHLHETEPWTTYTEAYAQHVFTTIEVFSGYDNTLAFLAGNEVIHKEESYEVCCTPFAISVTLINLDLEITSIPQSRRPGYEGLYLSSNSPCHPSWLLQCRSC